MVDTDLCKVARVVEDVDLLTNECRKGRLDVAPSHEADAVPPDLAWFRHAHEQHIQNFTAVRKGWQKASGLPAREGFLPRRSVFTSVIDLMKKPLEARRQFCEVDGRPGERLALDEVPGDVRQEHVVDGAEEPFDLAATAGAARPRMDQADLERDARLLDVLGHEVAAVIDVELLGYTADGPVRIDLAPDRLPKGQGGVDSAWSAGRQEITCDSSAVIVQHDRQPRADRVPVIVEHEDIEDRMVSLPHLVGRASVASMHEFVPVAVGRRVRRNRDTFRPDPPHDTGHDRVARACDTPCFRFGLNLAMNGCRSWPGTPGRHVPHKSFEIRVESPPLAGIAAQSPFQSMDAVCPPCRKPAAQGALRNATFDSYAGQRNVFLQMGLKDAKAIDGL